MICVIQKENQWNLPKKGTFYIKLCSDAVLASDGFFPFADTVEIANEYGIKAIIQPGGSLRDQESIDMCNSKGISMVFTQKRHFLH